MRERERGELYKTIWKIADDLRNEISSWELTNYILIFLFYRFISENFRDYFNKCQNDALGGLY